MRTPKNEKGNRLILEEEKMIYIQPKKERLIDNQSNN